MWPKLLSYSTLLLALTVPISVEAQQLQEWNTFTLRRASEATHGFKDSASISKLAYSLAYGTANPRQRWTVTQQIDSTRINAAVVRILENPELWRVELESVEPAIQPYKVLKRAVDSLSETKADSLIDWKKVDHALNQYRLINRLPDEMIVLVNVPSATLRVIDRRGQELLKCPVIVGSPSTPTPIFDAYLTSIITYPYWNVPRSIALKEFLPKIKKAPKGFLDAMKMQVVSSGGKLVAAETIDWKSLSSKNFPYRLRQSTGCDNALGVIKFDLDSPYDIYLHDTNHRALFGKKYRFLSHGCIRVAEPVKLANLLSQKRLLEETFTKTRYQNIAPHTFSLPVKVPVVITYILAEAENGLMYHTDIYKKFHVSNP